MKDHKIIKISVSPQLYDRLHVKADSLGVRMTQYLKHVILKEMEHIVEEDISVAKTSNGQANKITSENKLIEL